MLKKGGGKAALRRIRTTSENARGTYEKAQTHVTINWYILYINNPKKGLLTWKRVVLLYDHPHFCSLKLRFVHPHVS